VLVSERERSERDPLLQQHLHNLDESIKLMNSSRMIKSLKRPGRLLYSKAVEMAARWLHKPIRMRARTFWNQSMTLVFPDQVSLAIYRYGFFEEAVTRMLLERLKPGMVVLDIGAHFGFFSLLASTLVGPGGRVFSFEPTPSTFETLKRNVERLGNVLPHNAAAYSQDTTVKFRDFGMAFPAFNSIYSGRLERDVLTRMAPKTYDVPAYSLDHFAQQQGVRPQFVKIDAEGAEFDILQGMRTLLTQDKPDVLLEVGDKGADAAASSRDVVDHMLRMGYRAFEHQDGKLVDHQPLDRYPYNNLLFIVR
jgi:FkbM family methyltransferase